VELALYLAWNVAPGARTEVVPALLTGYATQPTDSHMTRIAIGSARHLLATFKSPHEWRRALGAYRSLPERWRGFDLDDSGDVSIREVATLVDRWQEYASALSSAPTHRSDGIEPAGAARHVARMRRTAATIDIPDVQLLHQPVAAHSEVSSESRGQLRVSWSDLLDTASWMDSEEATRGLPPGHWSRRLDRCSLMVYEESLSAFATASELAIDGVFNMAGMVSSGKSTLRDVLAVWAAKSGHRVVLVVGDVASVLRSASHLSALGIEVAPLIGQTNRPEHIARWHRLHQEARPDQGPLELDDRAFAYLSTACALDGLREASEPFPPDELPCERLSLEGTERLVACPFLPRCPVHKADRDAVEARVWIATPASLVYSRPSRTINPRRLRYLELAIRNSDLVIVDEADNVQAQLDTAFMPSQVLAGSREDSWLDRLEARVALELTSRARGQLSDRTISSWLTALRVASSCVNGIYTLLQQEPSLARWLGRGYFQEWSLALRLACEWTGTEPDRPSSQRDAVMSEFDKTFEELRGEGGDNILAGIAIEAVSTISPDRVRERLAEWIGSRPGLTVPESRLDDEALRLQLGLLVAALAGNLQYVYRQWHQVESVLGLETAGSGLLQGPPRDYEALIPDGPMGNVFGFQYLPPTGSRGQGGKLRSFRCAGMGRFVLLHLSDLLYADNCPGPNVLLLSGTCWAGSSPTHHLGLPVAGLLAPPESEVAAISRSQFDFRPFHTDTGGPITVSGAGDGRDAALAQLVARLADSGQGAGDSVLASELALLPEGRRRVLLVVNSYEQARLVGTEFGARSYWRGRCAVLIPDSADNESERDDWLPLRRGQVATLTSIQADLVVAPLLAIERGHNILNELGQAAIGSAYFLVRPHPQPDDIGFAIHSINRWAVDHYPLWASGPIATHDERSRQLRDQARRYWHHLISLPIRYGSLPEREREALAWTQLVAMVQVVGRLVRGGVEARVHFCDAAFALGVAKGEANDAGSPSLLAAFVEVLRPYLEGSAGSERDRAVTDALYRPFFNALVELGERDLARL
jgi:hypothetical protein